MIEELEQYAHEHRIPIMMKDGITFLREYIEKHSIHRILEIGTAIGYSAIQMCLVRDNIEVTTIERDDKRYREAVTNIEKFGLSDRIHVIYGDAFDITVEGMYDLIFIDAAKSQYIKFFEKFKKNLVPHGVIVSDNLAFHGYLAHPEEITSKDLRQMVRKIQGYVDFLKNNEEFETVFYDLGDGISVSTSRE